MYTTLVRLINFGGHPSINQRASTDWASVLWNPWHWGLRPSLAALIFPDTLMHLYPETQMYTRICKSLGIWLRILLHLEGQLESKPPAKAITLSCNFKEQPRAALKFNESFFCPWLNCQRGLMKSSLDAGAESCWPTVGQQNEQRPAITYLRLCLCGGISCFCVRILQDGVVSEACWEEPLERCVWLFYCYARLYWQIPYMVCGSLLNQYTFPWKTTHLTLS